jgi:hypothetical protein
MNEQAVFTDQGFWLPSVISASICWLLALIEY